MCFKRPIKKRRWVSWLLSIHGEMATSSIQNYLVHSGAFMPSQLTCNSRFQPIRGCKQRPAFRIILYCDCSTCSSHADVHDQLLDCQENEIKRLRWYGEPSKGELQSETQNTKPTLFQVLKKDFHPILSLHNYRDNQVIKVL